MPAPVRIVTARDYLNLVKGGAVPIDVRHPSEFVEGHVAGATSLRVERFLFRQEVRQVAGDRPVVLIADGPIPLELGLRELADAGATVAGILTGTAAQWQARGLTVYGWDIMTPGQWARKVPRPMLWDIREAAEPDDPRWTGARRLPLSAWLDGTLPAFEPDEPICLVGPRQRQILAAVLLYHRGARTLWAGDTTLPKIVADWGRDGTQGP